MTFVFVPVGPAEGEFEQPEWDKQIMAHARRDAPNEACGLLVEMNNWVHAVQCRNISKHPDCSFEIHPEDHQLTVRTADRVIGIYHSHPSGSGVPSATDLKFIPPDPGMKYFIATDDAIYEYEIREAS